MNYFCGIVSKEIMEKKIFPSKEEAIEYFNKSFGEDIYNDRKEKSEKIIRSIVRYDKRLNEAEIELADILEKKNKMQNKLNKLYEEMNSIDCYYVWDFDEYKKNISADSEFILLRVCGIYKILGKKYEVLEEVYKVTYLAIENVTCYDELFEKTYNRLRGYEAMIGIKDINFARIKRFISKTKLRVLNEHKKNNRRISNIV